MTTDCFSIEITPEDITEGVQGDSKSCAIARAVRRQGYEDVYVTIRGIHFNGLGPGKVMGWDEDRPIYQYEPEIPLTPEAQLFIEYFDAFGGQDGNKAADLAAEDGMDDAEIDDLLEVLSPRTFCLPVEYTSVS